MARECRNLPREPPKVGQIFKETEKGDRRFIRNLDSESDFRNPRAEISCLNNHWSARGSPASSPQAGARHFTSERRHLSSSTNQLLPKMSLAEAFIQLSASTSYLSRSSDLWTSMNGSTSSNGCKLKQDPAVAARTAVSSILLVMR